MYVYITHIYATSCNSFYLKNMKRLWPPTHVRSSFPYSLFTFCAFFSIFKQPLNSSFTSSTSWTRFFTNRSFCFLGSQVYSINLRFFVLFLFVVFIERNWREKERKREEKNTRCTKQEHSPWIPSPRLISPSPKVS